MCPHATSGEVGGEVGGEAARGLAEGLAAELAGQQAWLRRLARALVSDPHAADDLAQEVCRAALLRPPTGARASLRGWLRSVLRNAARMRARAESARAARERAVARAEALPSADELAAQAEAQRRAVEELLALPEPYRRTLLLHFLHELPAAEIARRDGEPAATVRARVARGLAELRQRLDRRHGGAREGWLALLAAPLAEPPIPHQIPPVQPHPALAGALAGLLAMKTLAVVLVSALTLTGAALLWRGLGSSEPSAPRGAIAAPPRPADVALGAAEPTPPAPNDAAARGARAALAAAPPSTAADVDAQPEPLPPARLRALVVDELGASVAGALLEVGGPSDVAPARTNAGGAVEVEVPASTPEWAVVAKLSADGFATHVQRAALAAGELLDLGQIELAAGVTLTGQVVDPDGNPVGGARVWAEPEDLPEYELDWLARKGPGVDLFEGAEQQELRELRSALADADGRFELGGVPAGRARLWGAAESYRFGWTDVLELAPAVAPAEVVLVLEPWRPTDFIAGVVQAPDGAPVQCWIQYSFEADELHLSSGMQTNPDGTFRLLLWAEVPVDFTARAPQAGAGEDWSDVRVQDVAPGTNDLVLRFAESAELEVAVVDAAGAALEEFGLEVAAPDDQYEGLWSVAPRRYPGGIARAVVPAEPFTVRAHARGYRSKRSEPLDPLALPARLTLTLERLPMLEGRVVHEGNPVAGARLELMRSIAGEPQQLHVNGLPAMMTREWGLESATSAGEGAFQLGYQNAGTYFVVADAEGFARAIVGPLRLDPARASDAPESIEVELSPGGALDVRVVVADGGDPVGRVVGITCGDGDPRSARVAPDGYAHFAGLTPGPWFVQAIEDEISASSRVSTSSATDDGEPMAIEWSCEVRAGRTTLHVLELAD